MAQLMRIAVLVVALSAGVAAAEPPGSTPVYLPPGMTPALEPPAPPTQLGYRWQTALADGAALSMVVLGASSESGSLVDMGLGTYLFGAPIVHLSHNRPGRAAGSLALRLGLPILGLMVGIKSHTCHASPDLCDEGPGAEAVIGLLGGVIAASVIDTAFLAKGDDAPARPSWSPAVTANQHGFGLGVAAAF
jgi:hypothetical protein